MLFYTQLTTVAIDRIFFSRFLFFGGFMTAIFLFSGCAYKLKATQRQLPGGYQSVAIPVFKNKTQETGIEVSFTNALAQQFQKSQVAHIVEKNISDVIAEGSIEKLSYEPQGKNVFDAEKHPYMPNGTVLAASYRVVMVVNVSLVRQSDKQVLWTSSFRGESSYSAPQVTLSTINTVNPLYNLSARRLNIEDLAQDMMTEAHNQMTESF